MLWAFRQASLIAFCIVCQVRQGNALQQMPIPPRHTTAVNYANTDVVVETSLAPQQLCLEDLRSKTLKDLKLMCSRRSLRYATFSEKEDYVQAVWKDMEEEMAFSVSGALCPGFCKELSGEQLDQEVANGDAPILLDVYATWCGPCKLQAREMDKVAYALGKRVRVAKLDSDKYPEWAAQFKVAGLPTTLVIKNGEVYGRLEGAFSKDRLIEFVQPSIQS